MKSPQLDDVISQIYEAPLNMSAWADALTSITYLIQASGGAQFHLWHAAEQRMLYTCTPTWVDASKAAFEKEYNERYAATDPRRQMVGPEAVGVWKFDQDHFDQRFMSRSEIYQALRRYDMAYTAGVKLLEAGPVLSLIHI